MGMLGSMLALCGFLGRAANNLDRSRIFGIIVGLLLGKVECSGNFKALLALD